jgi:trans-aconitate 2-methyltransferase
VAREWDGASYDAVSDTQLRWGLAVLDRLTLEPDAAVLDAGCGSGRVTEALLERFPSASVVALDGSASMLEQAERRLARFGPRVRYLQADLTRPLPSEEPVDAVVSTATFHWIADHDALFSNLAAALRPGGRLVAQCGGQGNIASVMAVLAATGDGWLGPAHFASPSDARRRLEEAGFTEVDAWLHDEHASFPSAAVFEEFLATVVLGPHLDRLAPGERPAFVRAVADRLPSASLDYVRLNIVARRAS